jgi:hypothetical protein
MCLLLVKFLSVNPEIVKEMKLHCSLFHIHMFVSTQRVRDFFFMYYSSFHAESLCSDVVHFQAPKIA